MATPRKRHFHSGNGTVIFLSGSWIRPKAVGSITDKAFGNIAPPPPLFQGSLIVSQAILRRMNEA